MTLRRLLIRASVCILALAIIDVAVGRALPHPEFRAGYRLPATMPTSELAELASHVRERSHVSTLPVVAFVGASPTWGDGVRTGTQAVPAAFARAAESSGTPVEAYNLGSNGQLVADESFVARSVAPAADLVVVQLTYHGFNPAWRGAVKQRYPELPRMLGVPVDGVQADALGIDPTPRPDVTGSVDRAARAKWRLYAERDRLAARFAGGSLESRLHDAWQAAMNPDFEGERDSGPRAVSFDRLTPDEQMLIIDEFSAAGSYRFDPTDSEAVMLDALAASLHDEGVRAVFYLSPMNREALASFDLYDAKQHAENAAAMRAIVEGRGHVFVDLSDMPLAVSDFADVNHTTARGSRLVAERLWTESAPFLSAR